MSVLARKITRAKWEQKADLAVGEIAADAVTVDLKTTGNTLSFWRCLSAATDDLKRASLALAAGSDRVDRLDVIYLDEHAIRGAGVGTKDTPGNTPVSSLREHHVDAEKLDLTRLGMIAQMVAQAHRTNAALSMTRKEVVELVVHAVRAKLVALEELKGEMKEKVRAQLEK